MSVDETQDRSLRSSMSLRLLLSILLLLASNSVASANDKLVRVAAPDGLIDTGLLKHVLPRFSLKTQVKIELVNPGDAADLAFGSEGRAVFSGPDETWHMEVLSPDHPGTIRLSDWLTSEIGQRAITGFAPEGAPLFTLPKAAEVKVAAVEFNGDAVAGRKVSKSMCGRCHVVIPEERMNAIGSTPSFMVLRTFADWEERFSAFYVLKPHGAFTQVKDVTPPFPEDRPSPIIPVEVTLDDIEAILAYVAALEPADLGAPLIHQ